jgi:hypothetical protein
MNYEQYKHLMLAGTITFPSTFPQLGILSLRKSTGHGAIESVAAKYNDLLVITERPSIRITISRCMPAADVRAVFLPHDPHHVSWDHGHWFLGEEVLEKVRARLASCAQLYGIVFVAEHTATLLEVEAGMTAAESAQYYPPLLCDRSNNHYDASGKAHQSGARSGYFGQGPALSPCEYVDPHLTAQAYGQSMSPCEWREPCELPLQSQSPYASPCEFQAEFTPGPFEKKTYKP